MVRVGSSVLLIFRQRCGGISPGPPFVYAVDFLDCCSVSVFLATHSVCDEVKIL
jgi:hypothetical protein